MDNIDHQWSKKGQPVNQQLGHGRINDTDAHGEWPLARLVRSHKRVVFNGSEVSELTVHCSLSASADPCPLLQAPTMVYLFILSIHQRLYYSQLHPKINSKQSQKAQMLKASFKHHPFTAVKTHKTHKTGGRDVGRNILQQLVCYCSLLL